MLGRWLVVLMLLVFGSERLAADEGRRTVLEYSPAPADNPLKGLVPYAGDIEGLFPHSMEFGYLPLSSLMTGFDQFDWTSLEKLLDDCGQRGHQVVFRIYLEYPDKNDGVPVFLIRRGLKVTTYQNATASPPSRHRTPDYSSSELRLALKAFIKALGKKYDGDSRIGFITAGLLGHWGEWHTYPREELFANREVQTEIMDAYEAAFKTTRVLLRYPAGQNDESKASNAGRRFGYHDDSFAWATLDTGRKEDDWFFVPALKSAGTDAINKWKSQPIGGEIRPEAWGKVFDEVPGVKEIQDFRTCVATTHVSWLMDSGMFGSSQNEVRRRRAEEEVRRMGYEFQIIAVTIGKIASGQLPVEVELQNNAVAPFYYDWPIEYGLIRAGKVIKTFSGTGKLTGLLPGDQIRQWDDQLDIRDVAMGQYKLAIRVRNPLPKGNPVRFANKSQDADAPGWLTLGEFPVERDNRRQE